MATTSRATSFLAEPVGDDPISERALGYVTEMAREAAFDLVATACVEAGVSRASLARRLNKDPAQVTRMLGAPGNWTLDTIAEMLFAIDGGMLRMSSYKPLEQPTSNRRFPACLDGITIEPGKIYQFTQQPGAAPANNLIDRHDPAS
ncbi:hypothetical protein [Mesorhizobium sp. J428]|uniref:hypothetical protein n=1 Tax=Mesorhizobium sp. J428 TaxID=2898440 RepID=UPI002150A46F|nr:hypothetical protein [Mesorhizobium sp. J428]MCR5859752.1 hypothetical protein [Mesorhizobium sp. J428]